MTRKKEADALQKDILAAFSAVPPPDEKDITPCGCEECQLIQADLKDQHWQTLPDDTLERHHDSLSLLSPRAFCFFLPSYLLAALKSSDSSCIDPAVIYNLTPPETLDPKRISWFLDRTKEFSSSQIATIHGFLRYMEGCGDEIYAAHAQMALSRYWTAAVQGHPPGIHELIPPPGEGETWIRMPNLVGRKATEAAEVLTAIGLGSIQMIEHPQHSSDAVEPGTVRAMHPTAGEPARFGIDPILWIGGPIQTTPENEQLRAEMAALDEAWADYRDNPLLPNGEKKRPPPFF